MIVPNPALSHVYTTTYSNINIGAPGHFKTGDVRLHDIARGLAFLCRFNGQLDRFYSVAEHSILVARMASLLGDEEAVIPALLHDAHEAYTGDIPRPVKTMVPAIAEYETAMMTTTRDALGLPDELDPVWERVETYDNALLHREMSILRPRRPDWYDAEVDALVPHVVRPYGHNWANARAMFLNALEDHGFRMPESN